MSDVSKATHQSQSVHKKELTQGDELDVSITESAFASASSEGRGGNDEFNKIPDRYTMSRANALYYSNDGLFSFNTQKFKDFEYFQAMKNKISSNWYPPLAANFSMGASYNAATNGITPGRLRVMAIPSQDVKIYFTMNRNGDVIDVEIVDSLGNTSLDRSCIDSIRNSKTFGPVPNDIPGAMIVIPFVFGYHVY